MSANRVATRYAKALVEVLAEKNALDQASSFMTFCDAAAGNEELSTLFANVTVNAEAKAGVVAALCGKLQMPELIARFLETVARNGRLGILNEIRKAVSEKMDEQQNIKAVLLTTSVALADDERDAFSKRMEEVLGAGVRVSVQEDADILGGAIARVGSTVFDGSVRGQLGRLRMELVKES